MLIPEQTNGHRIYRCTETGRTAISVTHCAHDVAFQDEDEFAGVPRSMLSLHGWEGTGCHTAALNWLAFTHKLLPSFEPPPKPPFHPDERRWRNVIANAVTAIQEWAEGCAFTPEAIEQPSVNWRYGIAGCPDLKGQREWRRHRITCVVELKFTAALTTAHRVQTRLYRKLEGYEDCRMGFLVNISRLDGHVRELPVYWDAEPHLDAKALCSAGRWR